MVRFAALISLVLIIPLTANGAPVDIRDVKKELENRGAISVQIALLSGNPVITGAIDEQGFTVYMSDCHGGETVCQQLSFKTCHSNTSLARLEALEWVNAYNQKKHQSGVAYVSREGNYGDVVCVKLDFDLINDSTFGIREAFAWTQTVDAFKRFVNEQERKALGRQILGR